VSIDITFAELYRLTNKELIIVVTNLSKQRPEYMSYKTEPDMKVLSAIRLTINIPIFFDAIKYKGDFYIDGAMSDNRPMTPINHKTQELLDKESNWETLMVSIKEEGDPSNIDSLDEYLYNIIRLMSGSNVPKCCVKDVDSLIIYIPAGISMVDFNLSNEKRNGLYQLGLEVNFDVLQNRFIHSREQ
jgi:NTE family protein